MKRLAIALLPFAVSLFAAQATAGDSNVSPSSASADAFHGAVAASIPIEVPPFHAMEPRLSLEYNSSRGNGSLGVGWALSGFSTIERTSPGGGAPTYGASDVFVLDGQELVPCAAGSQSPSCTSGGTHSTKIETFVRVAFDASTNRWTVTQKDGSKTIYGAVYGVAPGTFRWGATSTSDTSGNTVSYGWWCDPGADCYPNTVSYDGTVVTLYREARPDPITFANGSTLGQTSYRVKTIDVTVGGSRARAYQLTYATSANTSRSLLSSVQMFGRDATLDASGTVTGGTASPATTTTARASSQAFAERPVDGNGNAIGLGQASNIWNGDLATLYVADVNGDGKADVIRNEHGAWAADNAVQINVWLSNGDGTFHEGPVDANGNAIGLGQASNIWNGDLATLYVADVNGDGNADLVRNEHGSWAADNAVQINVWLSNGDGTFHEAPVDANGNAIGLGQSTNVWNGDLASLWVADVNGDGKADILRDERGQWAADNAMQINVWLSNGDGTFHEAAVDANGNAIGLGQSSNIWNADLAILALADVNGDGKADILRNEHGAWAADNAVQINVWLSNGDGTFREGPVDANGNAVGLGQATNVWNGDLATAYLADVNGDGKVDVLRNERGQWAADNAIQINAWLSNGDGSFREAPTDANGNAIGLGQATNVWNGDLETPYLVDVNGDGKTDILRNEQGSWAADNGMQINVWLANGDGTFREGPVDANGNAVGLGQPTNIWNGDYLALSIGDFDGDGKADVLRDERGAWASDNGLQINAWTGDGLAPDLVQSIANGLGGTTSFTYAPSSAWSNTNAPPIVQTLTSVTTADGRGNASTTRYAYAGGLFDATSRRFLGFHYVKTTLPCNAGESACPYEETWFLQDYGSQSKPQEARRSTGAGVLLTDTIHTYATNGATIPYVTLETGAWQYTYDGSGVGCSWASSSGTGAVCAHGARTYMTRAYDVYDPSTGVWKAGYGNLVQETAYGNYDVAGDELTTSYLSVPNPSAYIVGLSAGQSSYAGIGTSGALLSQGLVQYDGATSWNAAPVVGKPTQGLKWSSTSNAYLVTSATYDAYGSVVSETNEVGATTSYGIDATYHQYRTSVTNALGQTATASWDPVCAKPLSRTDANGQSATMTYDALCRLTSTSYPLGAFETRAYVAVGDPNNGYVEIDTPAADGSGNQWVRTYVDGQGRPWRTVRKGPAAGQDIYQDTAYGARGKTSQQSAPYYAGETPQWLSTTYDALDRIASVTAPDGSVATKSYGFDQGWGSVLTTDELGHQQRDTEDAYARPKWHYEWIGSAVTTRSYAYDARGNPTSITDGQGNVWTFSFDSLNRKLASNDPDAGSWTYAYDAAGRLVSQTDALGQTTTYAYDALGRRTSKTTRAGTAQASTVGWTYDQPLAGYANVGRLTSESDPSGGAAYGYDALGRLVAGTRTTDGVDYAFQKGFDAGGRLLWTAYPDGDSVGTPSAPLKYDGAGRLMTIPGIVSSASYDARGQLTQQVNANGTTTTRSYSSSRFWLTAIATSSASATIQNLGYARDAEGKITSVSSPFAGEGWSYGYDQHRLASATNASNASYSQTFTYDAYGNVTSSSQVGAYAYPAAGQAHPHAVVTAGANSYAYDANGNMISGAGRTIVYDGDGRPVDVNGVSFAYDADGSRIKKTNGSTTTYYLSDDYEVTYGVTTKYVSLAGAQVARRVGATTYWLHTDANGSIQAETDATGAEVLRQKYGPYGGKIEQTGSLAESRGYTAQRQDETGLVYLHARYFDPVIGRFLSPDPTVPSTAMVGLNRYAYAGNDPINHTDVNGMSWLSHAFHAIGHFFSQVGHAISNLWHGVVSLVNAAVHGDVKAILSVVVIVVVAIYAPELAQLAVESETGMCIASNAVLSVATTSFGAGAAYVGSYAATGFAAGFTVASINGASLSQAFHAGITGAVTSAALAAVSLAAHSFAADGMADDSKNDPLVRAMSPEAKQAAENPHMFPGPGETNFAGVNEAPEVSSGLGGAHGVFGWVGAHVPYGNYSGLIQDGMDVPITGLVTGVRWAGAFVAASSMAFGSALQATGAEYFVIGGEARTEEAKRSADGTSPTGALVGATPRLATAW